MAISPHTPPGTKVVCVAQDLPAEDLPGPTLTVGAIYTVARVVVGDCGRIGIQVRELKPLVTRWRFWFLGFSYRRGWIGYPLCLFRYLELPSVLTDALTSQPLIHEDELTVAL